MVSSPAGGAKSDTKSIEKWKKEGYKNMDEWRTEGAGPGRGPCPFPPPPVLRCPARSNGYPETASSNLQRLDPPTIPSRSINHLAAPSPWNPLPRPTQRVQRSRGGVQETERRRKEGLSPWPDAASSSGGRRPRRPTASGTTPSTATTRPARPRRRR